MGLARLKADQLRELVARLHPAVSELLGPSFRTETAADLDFSASLFAQTRLAELNAVPWTDAQRLAFCRQQFDAQHAHYKKHYPRAEFLIVEARNVPIGRVYFEQTESELRLMEITLDESFRQRGLGSAISHAIAFHAESAGLAAGLHVESFSPARRLYLRQGFLDVETRGIYVYMRREPSIRERPAAVA